MRVIIRFSENKEVVPVNNQSYLNYYIHKCLGENNEYHDKVSDYCISHLYGGKLNSDRQSLSFENGGYVVVTTKNESFLDNLFRGVMSNQNLNWGMSFKMFDFIKEEFLGGEEKVGKQIMRWHHFSTLSPFIIKKYSDKKTYTYSTLNDSDFVETVKSHIVKKLSKIYEGIDLKDFDVVIKQHTSHKVKKIMVKNVCNLANQCQVSVFCTADVAEKIYNNGIGQSCGSGFGTIYKTENHSKYKLGLKK